MNPKHLASPEAFIASIPRTPAANVMFRAKLHEFLSRDQGRQLAFLALMIDHPQIFFDTCCWTFNPRKRGSGAVDISKRPFILYPVQIDAVSKTHDAIHKGGTICDDKSRDMGATEIICKLLAKEWLLSQEFYALIGSHKEILVDKSTDIINGRVTGPPKCLFHKILMTIANLPEWWKVRWNKSNLLLQNPDNGAVIEGESTNPDFSVGGRFSVVFVDEMGRVEPELCSEIMTNIPDTTQTVLYNSTLGKWGSSHPYHKYMASGAPTVVVLDWTDHPDKAAGLYRSPAPGIIEILDKEYWRKLLPKDLYQHFDIFSGPFRVIDAPKRLFNHYNFISDGGEGTYGRPRSPWLDAEEARRMNKHDLAANILRIPVGATDAFFDHNTLLKLQSEAVPPNKTGELSYTMRDCMITEPRFEDLGGKGKFQLWADLDENGRLDQTHSYVVSGDISRGTGSSNSVLAIGDCNTRKLVGLYVDPRIGVTMFADLAVAVCQWVGGITKPLLIWEGNGVGETFDQRVALLQYSSVYYRTDTRNEDRKESKQRGWYSSGGENGTKILLLTNLDLALQEAVKAERKHPFVLIPDAATIEELFRYVNAAGKIDVLPISMLVEESGARFAHGDRVIAVGMMLLGMGKQRVLAVSSSESYTMDQFAGRMKERRAAQGAKEPGKFMPGGYMDEDDDGK